jgi:hypothetical protein
LSLPSHPRRSTPPARPPQAPPAMPSRTAAPRRRATSTSTSRRNRGRPNGAGLPSPTAGSSRPYNSLAPPGTTSPTPSFPGRQRPSPAPSLSNAATSPTA